MPDEEALTQRLDGASPGYALFETALGRCGLAWNARGVTAVRVPPASETWLGVRATPAPPPQSIALLIEEIIALLAGEPRDLSSATLDLTNASTFERRVYEAVRAIPPGQTATYGDIAKRIGEPGGARAVGAAMAANPFPIIVPCHRVLGADGAIGGFSAPGGALTKTRMLAIERARIGDEPGLFDHLPIVLDPRRGALSVAG